MLTSRNPGTRASNIYRERYAQESRTASHWEGTWGLVEPSALSPSRTPRLQFAAPSAELASPQRFNATLPALPSPLPRAAATSNSASPQRDCSPSNLTGSSRGGGGGGLLAPSASPIRTARRNYRHMSGAERSAFYASYIAKPQGCASAGGAPAGALSLPRVRE